MGKEKKEYRCPKMGDKKGFHAPKSAFAENYSDMQMEQMEETISAVVLAETYPENSKNRNLNKKDSKNHER